MSTRSLWIVGSAVAALAGVLLVRTLVVNGGAEAESLSNERAARVEPARAEPARLVVPETVDEHRPPVAVAVPPPPAEPAPTREPEPEPEIEPAPGAAPEELVELRLKVVDEHGAPLPEAAVRVRGPLAGDDPPERALDALGERVLTLLPEAEREESLLTIDASAPGRAPLRRTLQPEDPLLFTGGELRFVLESEASLEVFVRDGAGVPAASAVVVLMRARDERKDAPGALRLVTDEQGRARAEGLTAGTWSVQTVAWRDYDDAESVAVVLAAGANERLELEALRWGPELYASGRVVGSGQVPLSAEECDGLYLRRTDMHKRTNGVDADGAFFVKSVDAELSTWEMVRGKDVVSRPFELKEGWHDVVVTLDVP